MTDEMVKETQELAVRIGMKREAIAKQLMITGNYWSTLVSGRRRPGKLLRREIAKLRDRLKASGLAETA